MKVSWGVELAGTGMSVPRQIVANEDFVRRLDTSDEWIMQRTGIRERRAAAPGESTLTFATEASRIALEHAKLKPTDLDLILCATITPDHPLPALACQLQSALGCSWIPAFDVVSACTGFVWGTVTAAQYIHSGMAKNVLLVGADCMTRMADMEDRSSAILFGDGAGAAIYRRPTTPRSEMLAVRMGADGSRADLIWVPAGGSKEPATQRTVNERLHVMRMRGREVYKFAVTQFQELIAQVLDDAGVKADDIALLVPHQSNLRIIESAVEKLGFPHEKVVINIDRYGNTSAASVPIALHEARMKGRAQPGDLVLLVAFGAGLTWGATIMRI